MFADVAALGDVAHAEIHAGEIVHKAEPSAEHSDAQGAIVALVRNRFHRAANDGDGWRILMAVDIELEAHELIRPDIAGWRRARVPERPTGRPVRTRPDWVCEILSASNPRADLVHKFRLLQRLGVPHYWIVDPERQTLTVHRNTDAGYLVALTAGRDETVFAEPFETMELRLATLFGED